MRVIVQGNLGTVMTGIWRTEQAPQDFKQDILLPMPKKGNASLCSNHRTIALQSIAGKAYANRAERTPFRAAGRQPA